MQTYGFINQKGGVGKTTLAVHFSAWLKSRFPDSRVMLLDVDPQGSSQHWSNARQTEPTFSVFGKPSETIHKQFAELSLGYDFVVIDAPANVSKINGSSILCCDTVIIPVQPSSLDIWASAAILDVIDGLQGVSDRKACFLLNQVDERTNLSKAAVEALQSMPIPAITSRIAKRAIWPEAMGEGKTVHEMRPSSPAALEGTAAFEEILAFSAK